MAGSPFIHLHVHSAFSLAEGAISPKKLIKLCLKNKMPAVAVTDTNNLFGAMEFATEAIKAGIQPIIGVQIDLDAQLGQLVLLVQSQQGYRNLCAIISDAYMNAPENPRASLAQMSGRTDGLICLSGGACGPVAIHLLAGRVQEAAACLDQLHDMFSDRLYIEIQRHGLPAQEACEDALIDLAYQTNIPLVATNNCYFIDEDMHEAHDALLCIAAGRYISEEDRRKETRDHYFKNAEEMKDLFEDLPEAIENTAVIARRCSFLLKPVDPKFPAFKTKEGRHESEELSALAHEGLEDRLKKFVYTDVMDQSERDRLRVVYTERLDFELKTIIQMGFSSYFLIVSDFIGWSKDNNIPVGPGRGSGAGSVVAWALRITDLDPIRLHLLFERFLNPERVSLPDFDVDFCQDRRDEVIKYVQDRYGRDRVAQIITFGTLQARAVVRDVGRVLQMPYGQVDRIAKMIPNNPAAPVTLEEALRNDSELQAERYKDETADRLLTIALQLEGLYRHASTHAAGLVIADRPLQELLPLYRDPRSDMPVTQFNMKYVESAGLVKYDFLGLKTLTVIHKAVNIINRNLDVPLEILKIPLDDAQTFDDLSTGHSTGVFQLESSGMKDTLRRLKPNRFEDIIALVALYRPGPMDNIPKYIDAKDGREAPDYLHPKLKPMLEETFGIMIYQEQVMQAAQILSGYTLGSADLLRRAMGKKIKSEMDAQRDQFIEGAKAHSNVDADQAAYIFEQIEKFAGYGFNKSHAAAYALVSYQTAWLKAHYPVAFMAASMTLDRGNTDKLAVFKQALDRMNIALLIPDINRSEVDFAVEGDSIRYALAALKGVGAGAMSAIVSERQANGPYKSLEDFIQRLDSKAMNKRQFEALIASGAFDCFGHSRTKLHASAERLLAYAHELADERAAGQSSLFGGSGSQKLGLPPFVDELEWDPLEKLRYEFDAVGFYLSAHPLTSRQAQLERMKITPYLKVEEALEHKTSARLQMAGVLIRKQEKMSKSGKKFAFVQISDPTGVYEATVFSEILLRTREILTPGTSLLFTNDVEQQEDQLRFTVQDIKLLDEMLVQKLNQLDIEISNEKPIDKLRSLLLSQQQGASGVKIVLVADMNGQSVKVALPGKYTISSDTRNALYALEGVKAIQES